MWKRRRKKLCFEFYAPVFFSVNNISFVSSNVLYVYVFAIEQEETNLIEIIWNQWSGNHLIFTRYFIPLIDFFLLHRTATLTMFDISENFQTVHISHISKKVLPKKSQRYLSIKFFDTLEKKLKETCFKILIK